MPASQKNLRQQLAKIAVTIQMRLLQLLWILFFVPASYAQSGGYIDQDAVADLLNLRFESLEHIPEVFYRYHVLENDRNNSFPVGPVLGIQIQHHAIHFITVKWPD